MDAAQLLLSAWGHARGPVRDASILLNDPFFIVSFSALLVIAASLYFKEGRKIPFLVSAVVVALLLGFSFKSFLQEERPCALSPSKIPCPTDFSLPSMHALLAFTIAIIALGTRSFPIYLFYALFIAFSRVYLGVHTITEVAAGLSLAFLACVLTELLFRRMKWHVPHVVHIHHDMERLAHTSSKTKIGE
jgi:membrane-associated phospholipid phosphatase